jgi:chromosome segregation ATPase
MRTQTEREAARQQRRLAKLTDERTKLLHAYYQNAIPLDLLHQEQERISTQTANAERQLQTAHRSATDVQATLQEALDLLAASPDAYANAPGHLRRQWNQALFLRLLVHDQDIQHAEIAEPFATLTTPSLPDELDYLEQEPRHTPAQDPQDAAAAFNGHGSNKGQKSGRPDLNRRPPAPKAGALPGCATPR